MRKASAVGKNHESKQVKKRKHLESFLDSRLPDIIVSQIFFICKFAFTVKYYGFTYTLCHLT